MSDDTLHINVVGGSQAEGELKKVAGGYRAIGKAADQAAHSAGKVHGGGGHERQQTQAFSKAFLGGRGGLGGSMSHMKHLGAAGAVAYVGMEAARQAAEMMHHATEDALENIKFQRDIAREIASIDIKRGEMALAAARNMDTFDKGREEHENSALGLVIKQAEVFERMKQTEEKATRARDASGALSAEKSAYANPALTAVMEKLKPMQDDISDKKYEADHESKFERFLLNFTAVIHGEFSDIGNKSAEARYNKAQIKYTDQSSEAIDKAMAEDKARRLNIDAAEKLSLAATGLHAAVTRSTSSLPGP